MWYPTAHRLPGNDVLVAAGFKKCCDGDADANNQLALYHPKTDSWTKLGGMPDNLITPGIKDYTHIWSLPRPVMMDGLERHVVMAGYQGTLSFYNTDPATPEDKRWTAPPNPSRASGGTAWDSTALLAPTGELLIAGGGNAPATIDLYDPTKGSWRSIDTGVRRDNGASVLLPDGTVLLINGGDRQDPKAVPAPQIFDPFKSTGAVETLPTWSADGDARAYHSFALLLRDGRVLLGGGLDGNGHEIGCERTDMRVFTPPYLGRGAQGCVKRPVVKADRELRFGQRADAGDNECMPTTVRFEGPSPRKARGASLMALGSFTHAFDQNQRYVALDVVDVRDGEVDLVIAQDQVPISGVYNLFLIAEDGTPSEGVTARIVVG